MVWPLTGIAKVSYSLSFEHSEVKAVVLEHILGLFVSSSITWTRYTQSRVVIVCSSQASKQFIIKPLSKAIQFQHILRIAQQLAQNKKYILSSPGQLYYKFPLSVSYYIKPPQFNRHEHVNYSYVRLGEYVHRMDGNIVVNRQFAT